MPPGFGGTGLLAFLVAMEAAEGLHSNDPKHGFEIIQFGLWRDDFSHKRCPANPPEPGLGTFVDR